MAANKRKKKEIERDLVVVSELYLKGHFQKDIPMLLQERTSASYLLTQQMISRDLQKLREIWREEALDNINEMTIRELAKLDKLEQQYWLAWERSCQKSEKTITKARSIQWTDNDDVKKGTDPQVFERYIQQQERDGNKDFLDGVLKCIQQRCRILGIEKVDGSGSNSGKPQKIRFGKLEIEF